MPEDPKKQVFVFAGDDDTDYEFVAPTREAAIAAAREFATKNKIGLTSKFEIPENEPMPGEMPDWMKVQKAQNEAALSENRIGGPLAGLGLGKLAMQAPKLLAGLTAANIADPNTAPKNEGNRLMRDLIRTVPALAASGTGAGVASFGIGRLLDLLFKENNAQAPGKGEIGAELASNVIPGLSATKGGPRLVEGARNLAAKHPILSNILGSGASSEIAAQDRTTPPGMAGATGMALAGATSGAGRVIQRGLRSLPSIETPEVEKKLAALGYRPDDINTDRDVLSDVSQTMGRVKQGVERVEADTSLKQKIADTARKVESERTAELDVANQNRRSALKVVAAGQEDEALKRLTEARDLKKLRDKIASARNYSEKATAEAAFDQMQNLVTQRRAAQQTLKPLKQDVLIDADTYRNRLLQEKTNNVFAKREREIQLTAANEELDKIARTGFDPRQQDPDQIATIKVLANEDPGKITQKIFDDKNAALTRVIGMRKLFGEKSKEFDAVKNYFIHEMFSSAIDDSKTKFAGRALSGNQLGQFLAKVDSAAMDELLGSGTYKQLRNLENVLTRSAKIRTPGEGFKIFLTPAAIGSALGGLYGGSENGMAYGAVGLATAAGVVGMWKTLPAFLDDIMRKDNVYGQFLKKVEKDPNIGRSTARTAAKLAGKTGFSTLPIQEQTTSAPQ